MRLPFLAFSFIVVACSQEGTYQTNAPRTAKPKAKSNPQAENVAGRNAQGPGAEKVSEKLFNVAILTKSVQCLFCHMKIEGDVGGIQFPANDEMHVRAGEGLRILGTLYGTNEVPAILGRAPQSSKVAANYKNKELKIFPTTVDGSGQISFPVVSKEQIAGKTKGSIKAGGKTIQDKHAGHLTIVDDGGPIEIDGEIFVDGDVIIGGKYRGVGTIYARNIFVVRDLQATVSPFPFGTDPAAAKEKAKRAIDAKNDGLYLFSLGQITVGYPDRAFLSQQGWRHANLGKNSNTSSLPPVDISNYVALAKKKSCSVINGHKWIKDVLINRVDAFLYASDYLLWRTCEGFELNGGFVAPDVALVNAGDAEQENEAREPTNMVRYDYRLRAGIKAFSVLKDFFEQE
jgi:hypothetical protein